MILAIHQPEHLPWLGFFDKVFQADTFVILDSVQYRKNYYQNRNKICGRNGVIWITVPVLAKGRSGQTIDEVQINEKGNPRWRDKYWSSVEQCYEKAPFWSNYCDGLYRLFDESRERLCDLNIHLIEYLIRALAINVKVVRASQLDIAGNGSELILHICRKMETTTYLSGISGKDYLNLDDFRAAGIKVTTQEFYHPIYRQANDPFQPFMSIVDLLFNFGQESIDIITGKGVDRIEYTLE